jgi:hypothetical protein
MRNSSLVRCRHLALLPLFFALIPGYADAAPRRRVVKPFASLEYQNWMADRYRLKRYRSHVDLSADIAAGKLVRIHDTGCYCLDPKHIGQADRGRAALYAHALPAVREFLDRELCALHRATGERPKVTSLVRTAAYQRLLRRGGNPVAAPGRGNRRSSHLTGATVDFTYLGLSEKARLIMRRRLLALMRLKAVAAVEESYSACFHVMVFPDYAKRSAKSPP